MIIYFNRLNLVLMFCSLSQLGKRNNNNFTRLLLSKKALSVTAHQSPLFYGFSSRRKEGGGGKRWKIEMIAFEKGKWGQCYCRGYIWSCSFIIELNNNRMKIDWIFKFFNWIDFRAEMKKGRKSTICRSKSHKSCFSFNNWTYLIATSHICPHK